MLRASGASRSLEAPALASGAGAGVCTPTAPPRVPQPRQKRGDVEGCLRARLGGPSGSLHVAGPACCPGELSEGWLSWPSRVLASAPTCWSGPPGAVSVRRGSRCAGCVRPAQGLEGRGSGAGPGKAGGLHALPVERFEAASVPREEACPERQCLPGAQEQAAGASSPPAFYARSGEETISWSSEQTSLPHCPRHRHHRFCFFLTEARRRGVRFLGGCPAYRLPTPPSSSALGCVQGCVRGVWGWCRGGTGDELAQQRSPWAVTPPGGGDLEAGMPKGPRLSQGPSCAGMGWASLSGTPVGNSALPSLKAECGLTQPPAGTPEGRGAT